MNQPSYRLDLIGSMSRENLEVYCEALEKALDKACDFIEDYCTCPYDVKDFCKHTNDCNGDYARCWKEWALNDE